MRKDLPRVIKHDALYIGAVDDPVLKPELAAGMPRVMPNLKQELVYGGGHWLLWEKKDEVIDILQRWLKVSKTAAALSLRARVMQICIIGHFLENHLDLWQFEITNQKPTSSRMQQKKKHKIE
ncbi:hypothetical protein F442_12948 [Phytophthora nicotianae P10297]|uniref:AB hydrolase-1 domain-containing protein n=1 Tax=Phytophthora nicotianae P10297 TaxID=1317064 RepID=W2YWT6_PHYNI|nr:hypothetical protein F442_12948 [Phytophthora nicotianae P10297]